MKVKTKMIFMLLFVTQFKISPHGLWHFKVFLLLLCLLLSKVFSLFRCVIISKGMGCSVSYSKEILSYLLFEFRLSRTILGNESLVIMPSNTCLAPED